MNVPGSVPANYPVPGKQVGLCQPQGLGKVCQNIIVGLEVFQKFLYADYLVPVPVSGGVEYSYGAQGQTQWFGSQGYPIVRTVLDAIGQRASATKLPLLL